MADHRLQTLTEMQAIALPGVSKRSGCTTRIRSGDGFAFVEGQSRPHKWLHRWWQRVRRNSLSHANNALMPPRAAAEKASTRFWKRLTYARR